MKKKVGRFPVRTSDGEVYGTPSTADFTRAMWMYEKRVKGGAKRKHTFGAYCTWSASGKREDGPVSLSDARTRALEIEAEATRGIDRVEKAQEEKRQKEAAIFKQLTVRAVLETYSDLHLNGLRRGKERLAQLTKALEEHLEKPITELTRADMQAAVDAKAAEGRKTHSNRIRAALLAFSKWAWGRNYIDSDIGDGVPKATKETVRERAPSIDEVRQIWAATFEMGELWGPALRLMILTAQRRGEILGLLLLDFTYVQVGSTIQLAGSEIAWFSVSQKDAYRSDEGGVSLTLETVEVEAGGVRVTGRFDATLSFSADYGETFDTGNTTSVTGSFDAVLPEP